MGSARVLERLRNSHGGCSQEERQRREFSMSERFLFFFNQKKQVPNFVHGNSVSLTLTTEVYSLNFFFLFKEKL